MTNPWQRLTHGLRNTTGALRRALVGIKAAPEDLDALEEHLLAADLGPRLTADLMDHLRRDRSGQPSKALRTKLEEILRPVQKPLPRLPASGAPLVMMVVGINGSGKTATVGKIAGHWRKAADSSSAVVVAAADTFRAAAIEQVQLWAQRAGAQFVSLGERSDSAAVAFQAVREAHENGARGVLIDTAGRVHNNRPLMDELGKIDRAVGKAHGAPADEVVIVLDSTVGQNALAQVEAFASVVTISGMVISKLDGSARGGTVVALAHRFGIPIYGLGLGEGLEDLAPFEASAFAAALVGQDAAADSETAF
ncbi:MAG: signal recognition particle-docking protein FtsY [Pseudomonadota bacterium]